MKIKTSTPYFVVSALILTACNVRLPSETTPAPTSYGMIDKTAVINGFPKNGERWVVISERSKNTVTMDKRDEMSPKEVKFLEPLMVIKHNSSKRLLKVAEYDQNALMQKLPVRSVKTYGWIPEENVLLWRNALKSQENGFTLKATLAPNSIEVIKGAEKYMKNDSVLIFDAPDLSKPVKTKLPVGKMVYIYKQSDNNKRYLIGKSPQIQIDSIDNNIYGWVSSNMVAYWGERSALKIADNYKYEADNTLGIYNINNTSPEAKPEILLTDAVNRTAMENVFPVSLIANKNGELNTKTRFFQNVFNYNNNFVYNALGEPLYFDRYKEVIKKNKNLNIVFTIDISNENAQSTSIAKTVFQNIQVNLDKFSYYKNVKYGVVLYRNNTCGENVSVSELSNDYADVSKFIDNKLDLRCSGFGDQPLQEGLAAAGSLLSTVPDETNIVVVIGSTAPANVGIQNAIRQLTQARAKIISYQTISKSPNGYNNFVVVSEDVVTNSAKSIADEKKRIIVDQKDVVNKNNYDLVQGGEGYYSLDYPKTSMVQGFVIFPKKGDVNTHQLLVKSIDSIVSQVTYENKRIDASLKEHFKSNIGVSKTELKPEYRYLFSEAPNPIPYEAASQLLVYEYPFLVGGRFKPEMKDYNPGVEKGILVSSAEYDQLRDLYRKIYQQTILDNRNFSQSKAVSAYLKILKDNYNSLNDFPKRTLYEQPMAYSVAMSTGFDVSNEELMSKYMLKGWKKNKIVPENTVRKFFEQFKTLSDALLENKNNPKIRIEQNGEVYYWLNQLYMPSLLTEQERANLLAE